MTAEESLAPVQLVVREGSSGSLVLLARVSLGSARSRP